MTNTRSTKSPDLSERLMTKENHLKTRRITQLSSNKEY